jgi:hypothetical protein
VPTAALSACCRDEIGTIGYSTFGRQNAGLATHDITSSHTSQGLQRRSPNPALNQQQGPGQRRFSGRRRRLDLFTFRSSAHAVAPRRQGFHRHGSDLLTGSLMVLRRRAHQTVRVTADQPPTLLERGRRPRPCRRRFLSPYGDEYCDRVWHCFQRALWASAPRGVGRCPPRGEADNLGGQL